MSKKHKRLRPLSNSSSATHSGVLVDQHANDQQALRLGANMTRERLTLLIQTGNPADTIGILNHWDTRKLDYAAQLPPYLHHELRGSCYNQRDSVLGQRADTFHPDGLGA